MFHPRRLWPAFVRTLIALLMLSLAGLLVLARSPGLMRALFYSYIPGVVEIPVFTVVPAQPVIDAPPGDLPGGVVGLTGRVQTVGLSFGCGFLLALGDGRRVGVATAHAAPAVAPEWSARFYAVDGSVMADLPRMLARGRTFRQDHFGSDTSIWSVDERTVVGSSLQPDPRGQAQVGERVVLYSNREEGAMAGVVMVVLKEATWIQLDEVIDPRGLSGCPVVSAYTGRLIGMAVAGSGGSATVIGLNPVGLLVEKAAKALGP
jgi:hypothetical protein